MSDQERKNMEFVRAYMEIAYDPQRAGGKAPEVHTLEQHADAALH